MCCGVDGIYLMCIIWDYIMFSFFLSYTVQKPVFCLQHRRRGVARKTIVQPIVFIHPAFRAVRLEGLLESISCLNHFNTHFPLQDHQGGCKKMQVA